MEATLIVLGTAVFVFALLKALFSFLAWLFPEADRYYRANLDAFFELLDESSLFEIGHRTLVRLNDSIRALFKRFYLACGVFCAVSFIINTSIFVLVSMDVINAYFFFDDWSFEDLLMSIERAGWTKFVAMILLVGLLGALFDLFSLGITLSLLNRASRSRALLTLNAHLLLDIAVAIVACFWAYGILSLVIEVFYDELWQNVAAYATSATNPVKQAEDVARYLQPTLAATLDVVSGLWSVIIWLGISTALPTIVYLIVLLPILVTRAAPNAVQRGVSRIVYLVTTDSQPVLKQVAVFSSNTGGLIAAVIAWMRLPPG